MSARSATPGPGTYASIDPTNHKTGRQPAFGFGGGSVLNGSNSRDIKRPSSAPGPGQYNPGATHISAFPNWGFGSASRAREVNSGTPGPGTYVAPSGLEGGPKHTMTPRREQGRVTPNPGPGSYAPEGATTAESAPRYGFGTNARDRHLPNSRETPGPGTYGDDLSLGASQAAVTHAAPKHTMTPRRTPTNNHRDALPGPGTYGKIEDKGAPHHASAPSWGFGSSKRIRNNRDANPGPGSYPVDDRPVVHAPPCYSMASRQGKGELKQGPGPGTYSPIGRAETPQWVFGTDGRSRGVNSAAPGPGSYERHEEGAFKQGRGEGPQYTMVGRQDQQQKGQTPGPGAYESTDRPDSRDQPKWGFGTSKRNRGGGAGTPGPGSYEMGHRIGEGPKYSVRGRTNTHQTAIHSGADGTIGNQYTTFGY